VAIRAITFRKLADFLQQRADCRTGIIGGDLSKISDAALRIFDPHARRNTEGRADFCFARGFSGKPLANRCPIRLVVFGAGELRLDVAPARSATPLGDVAEREIALEPG
jgi:hypothetical protein